MLSPILGSPAEQAGVVVAQRIDQILASDSNIQNIRSWMGRCERLHVQCWESFGWLQKHSKAPTRLLDIESPKQNWVRLVETHGQVKQYVALSYCWGKTPPKLLTIKETYHKMLLGVPCRLLPKTVQDAIIVTKSLAFGTYG